MYQLCRSRFLVSFISSFLLVILIFPALGSAESAQKLVTRLPGNNKLVAGMDVDTAKTSPLYNEAMKWIRVQSNLKEILTLLETEGGFNVDADLQSVAMVSPEVPTSVGGALNIPFTVALSGKFDREKITAAIKTNFPDAAERKEAKINVLTTDKHDLGFIDDKTLVLVSGPKTYQSSSWQALRANKATHNAKFKAIVTDVIAEHNLWIIMDSASMSAAASQGAKANFSAMALRAVNNLGITMLSHFQNEKDAALALQETEKLKIEAQSNPMLAMAGLGPLLKNLATKQDKSKVWITSSMTVAEARTLLTRVQAIAERSQSLKTNPLISGGAATPESAPTDNKVAPPKKSGAAADFN